MNATLLALLAQLAKQGAVNDAEKTDRSQKMLNLEPETAQLVSILVRNGGYTRVLEIGTSNGYSTIWLADAMHSTGGHVTTLDRSTDKHALAEANLRRAGLLHRVKLISGDATASIEALTGLFDCIFFDADRISAPDQLQRLMPKLTPKALLLADNALSHPDEIAGYLAAVKALPAFDHLIVPIGKGLSVAYRQSN